MDASTPVSKDSMRHDIIQDPELESPIMSFKVDGNKSDGDGSVDTNATSSDQSSYVSLSKNLISNMSNELRGSKIGKNSQSNNSSLEYATGASCFQDVAILSGLMDANGAAILDNEDTNEHQQNVTAATAEEEAIIT